MAEEYPGRVRGAVVGLITLLDDTDDMPRGYAAWALRNVAEKFPGDVRGRSTTLPTSSTTPMIKSAGLLWPHLENWPRSIRTTSGP